MHKYICLLLSVCLLSASCGRQETVAFPAEGDTIPLRYAENLTLLRNDSFTVARLRNPWDTAATLHTYILIERDQPQPSQLPEGTVVRVPLRRAVVYSSVHCSLLDELEVLDAVGGVCDPTYIQMEKIQKGIREGRIQDYGDSMNPDIERIMDTHPDALMPSPFENSGGYGRLEKLQIPIIECADYMETSPLGRAEWIRFYGRLFGRTQQADSLFLAIEQQYNTLKAQAAGCAGRPTVLSDLRTGGSWYVPGSRSTISRLYADAAARSVFDDRPESGSVALSFETVFEQAQNADFWLVKYYRSTDMTRSDLKADYASYARFRPFAEGRIYGCNTSHVRYYEETPFHPERLLADFVALFHPEVLPNHSFRYFTPLP
ncbi:MAG: ABC transporter substrate-binding protein [Paraprevotella sp.]|nr:ABC transporter substrate-binding protein [Paraprevotella sp.]